MRQHDDIETTPGARSLVNAPDRILELRNAEELDRGERADGNHELRLQQRDLAIEMRTAVRDLGRIGHTIAAGLRITTGKAANHGGDVDLRAKLFLADAEVVGEPGEEAAARGVSERAAVIDLVRPRRLSDEHHARIFHGAGDRRAEDIRTRAASAEHRQVFCEIHSAATITFMHRVFASIVIFACAASAHAWTATSDQRIAAKAAELAPNDLRVIIDKYNDEYQRGLSLAASDEGADTHRYFVLSRNGHLRERIERETANVISMLRANKSMSQIVLHLGILAHYVADANNPFHVANDDPNLAAWKDDYERYFESRMRKFPTVFYGLESNFQLSSYLDQTFDRTAKFYPLIDEEYFRFGEQHDSSEFDDRSTAFGVASVCYSRAVTDTVNLYFYIWGRAGGDVRALPLLKGGNLLLNAANAY